ncbi:MAG: MAE_28990/MAE_18760 family HEPN-like nuclease [Saprospiraceae bacterium]|jgi:hypothetical protein|nr:MAE_28990/MAE_18760 family HEPN-like nuclease [Saprospiraceae bacterium]
MFSALENRCLQDIDTIYVLLDSHESLIETRPDISHKIKIYSVSACVTRLYAIYENFVETAVSDYLDSLSECVKFDLLPYELKTEYRMGISYILSKIDQGRYDHLTHENIIKWYYEAHSGIEPYKFVTNALTRHEQNFRLNILVNAFNRVQLKDLTSWLSNHPNIKSLYPDDDSFYQLLEAEIKDFIQLRNDAAHGSIDALEGRDSLNRHCEVIKALIISIGSYLRKNQLLNMLPTGKAREIGFVSECFPANGAFVAKLKIGTEINLYQNIYFLDRTNCYSQPINSIRINDESVIAAKANTDEFEVGIKCNEMVKTQAKIIMTY